jgi:hypothetical protein
MGTKGMRLSRARMDHGDTVGKMRL